MLAEPVSALSGIRRERLLPALLPEASPPILRRRGAAPALPIGILLYLVSIGIIATATVGIFFGIGFFLLVQPRGAMIPSTGERDLASIVKPLLSHLVPDFFSSSSPGEGRDASAAIEPEIPHSVATAALPVASHVQLSEADQTALPAKSDAQPTPIGVTPASVVKDVSSGYQKQGSEARDALPATPAPAAPLVEPERSSAGTAAASGLRASAAEITQLLARGDALLRTGDVTSARLFYERAADAGNGQAALRMGATFDPTFLGRAGLSGTRGDPAKAQSWYSHAIDLGAAEADHDPDSEQKK